MRIYKPGTIDDILVGRVWEFDISQGWALGGLALMAVPSLMVFLSITLSAAAARRANLVAAAVYTLVSIGNAAGETWAFVWLGSALEVTLLLFIVRYAWSWPRPHGLNDVPMFDASSIGGEAQATQTADPSVT